MKEQINSADSDAEYYFHEGCFITECSNSSNDPECSIAKARVEPRCVTKWHSLRATAERYVILQGSGIVEVGDNIAQQVSVGDVVLIPNECRQRITNNTNEDLVFLAICTPRFLVENYIDLE